jgi:hypothetical protein
MTEVKACRGAAVSAERTVSTRRRATIDGNSLVGSFAHEGISPQRNSTNQGGSPSNWRTMAIDWVGSIMYWGE